MWEGKWKVVALLKVPRKQWVEVSTEMKVRDTQVCNKNTQLQIHKMETTRLGLFSYSQTKCKPTKKINHVVFDSFLLLRNESNTFVSQF